MRDGFERHFADLRPVLARTDAAVEITFEHAHDRFNLASLGVGLLIELPAHQSSVPASRRAVLARAALHGRNRRTDMVLFTKHHVIAFRIISGVGEKMLNPHDISERAEHVLELVRIRRRAARAEYRENDMRTHVGDDMQLGITPVGHVFRRITHAFRTPDVVSTGMRGIEPGGVHGAQGNASFPLHETSDRAMQHSPRILTTKQTCRRLLQRREVRHLL